MSAKPPLSQHFLADAATVRKLLAAAEVAPGETALDLGAGDGAIALPLTEAVGPRGACVAIELDPRLAAALRARAPPHLTVLEADALQAALPAADVVVANPPFRIAAPLVLRLLDAPLDRAVLVLPEELADRLTAKAGDARYGRLTVQAQLRAGVVRCFGIPRRAFAPPPGVPCAAVRLDPHGLPDGLDADVLEALLEAAFASARRTLRHGLAPLAAKLRVPSGTITEALRARGWEQRRPAELAPRDYAALAEGLMEAQAAAAR